MGTPLVIAINGSPRRRGNTAQVLDAVLEGAAGQGARTELAHLAGLRFTGCASCFACKLRDGRSLGRCALRDDATGLIERVLNADAVVFGSPIYFQGITGAMRSFLERLLFPLYSYRRDVRSMLERYLPAAFVYTMNVDRSSMQRQDYRSSLQPMEHVLADVLGSCRALHVCDTLQFDHYERYESGMFDGEHKRKVREEQFPRDLARAAELGCELVRSAALRGQEPSS
ncbi:MAG: flavodoxin family protein [Coriobacteriia bacterium]|nr:flavodoxin family protein [Coriobacteriia bacterium]MBS5478589.1 flavodoxin family protein [Coriobacteriia bacterium]